MNNNCANDKDKKINTGINSVNISDVELAMRVINELPDVREERIKAVKEKYSNLDYEEDAEKIADKILTDKIQEYEIIEKFKDDTSEESYEDD